MYPTTQQANTLPAWIAQVNEFGLGWYTAITQHQQIQQQMQQPGWSQIYATERGIGASIDPQTLLLGAVLVVAVVWAVNQ